MSYMFRKASSFNQAISTWNVSNVRNMSDMFNSASSFNQSLAGWDVSNVTNMNSMLYAASAFNQNLENWKLKSVRYMISFFSYSGINRENYSLSLLGWATNPVTISHVNFNWQYDKNYNPNVATARHYLIDSLGWSIAGDN